MTRETTPATALLLAILAVHLVLAAANIVLFPVGSGADENAHLDYALHLATEKRLPDPATEPVGQLQHPPLAYAIYAVLFAAAKPGSDAPAEDAEPEDVDGHELLGRRTLFRPGHTDGLAGGQDVAARVAARRETPHRVFYLMRALAALLGCATLVLLSATLRRLFPEHPGRAVLAVAALALTPHFSHHFSMISNDPWLTFLATLAAWHAVRARDLGRLLHLRALAVTSLIVGLAFLTKLHAIGIFVLLAVLVGRAPRSRSGGLSRPIALAVLAAGPLLVSGWWYLRQGLSQGGPLSIRHHADFAPYLLRLGDFEPIVLLNVLDGTVRSFFGVIGQDALAPPALYFLPVAGVGTLAAFGALFLPSERRRERQGDETPVPRPPVGAALLAVGVLLAAILVANRSYYHVHGRYLYGVLVPVLIVLVAGLERLVGERTDALLRGVAVWNAAFLVLTIVFVVTPRYSIAVEKVRRGRVVQYYDCGNEPFDQEDAGGDVATRRYPELHRPQDTLRFSFQVTPKPDVVYRFAVPDPSLRYQIRVRYPSPFPISRGDVPAPTGSALLADSWMIHGPHSMWAPLGELHFPLPSPITADGRIEVWWQNHAPGASGIGVSEIWLEEAWLQIREAPHLLGDGRRVDFYLSNIDDRAHAASVFLTRGEDVVGVPQGAGDDGIVRLAAASEKHVRLESGDATYPASQLRVRVVDRDAGPWASAKLVYWKTPAAVQAGSLAVPDLLVLRHRPRGHPGGALAEVTLRRVLRGRYTAGISHPAGQSPFLDGVLALEVDGARLEGEPEVADAGYGTGLAVTSIGLVQPEPGEATVTLRLMARPGDSAATYEVDRLIVRRDPRHAAFGQEYGVSGD